MCKKQSKYIYLYMGVFIDVCLLCVFLVFAGLWFCIINHSYSFLQDYPPSLQADYQPIGAMLNSGAVMSSSVDYHQLGRHTPNHHPSLDWSADYHGNGWVLEFDWWLEINVFGGRLPIIANHILFLFLLLQRPSERQTSVPELISDRPGPALTPQGSTLWGHSHE